VYTVWCALCIERWPPERPTRETVCCACSRARAPARAHWNAPARAPPVFAWPRAQLCALSPPQSLAPRPQFAQRPPRAAPPRGQPARLARPKGRSPTGAFFFSWAPLGPTQLNSTKAAPTPLHSTLLSTRRGSPTSSPFPLGRPELDSREAPPLGASASRASACRASTAAQPPARSGATLYASGQPIATCAAPLAPLPFRRQLAPGGQWLLLAGGQSPVAVSLESQRVSPAAARQAARPPCLSASWPALPIGAHCARRIRPGRRAAKMLVGPPVSRRRRLVRPSWAGRQRSAPARCATGPEPAASRGRLARFRRRGVARASAGL